MALYSLGAIRSIGEKSRAVSFEILPGVNNLLQADRDLYQAMVAERSLMFIDAESPEFASLITDHRDNIKQARDRVGEFAEIILLDETKAKLKKFYPLFDLWVATTNEIVNQRANNDRIGRRVAIDLSFGKGAEQFSAMRELINELTDMMLEVSEKEVAALDAEIVSDRMRLLTGLAIGLGLCIFVAIGFPRVVTGPLQRVIARIEDIADGDGDLTARIEVTSTDELGHLAAAFNRFVEKLQGIISEIAGSTTQLAAAAEEMSAITHETSNALASQQSEVEQVATAMNEMSATAQDVARNAAHAAEAAQEANSQASQGTRVITSTIAGIRGLANEVQQASAVISQLEADTDSIGTVLDVIRGIAEQTNLLALNAAIEAARAGEQGRGFAVVADEVRTLAQRTQHSTREIQGMIERLQTGSQQAVQVMEKGCAQARGSVDQAANAETSLSAITSSIVRILDMNTQIASAAEEQTAVAEEINRSMTNVNDLTEQTAGGAQQTASAVTELARLATRLDDLVGQFKVA
jgi:methyl-accepting chemotaxis protein